ncbi:DUF3793 family protein [Desulfitobacterium sp. Sab5]|uniref:DUF3793 family protein n=1 Tax=Desulfitobacterium nosdiversum TaxID=3375356 RepID=UPI003CF28CBF
MTVFLSPEKSQIIQNRLNNSYLNTLVKWVNINDQLLVTGCNGYLKQNEKFCYLLECLGPVILNIKPAELLNIGHNKNPGGWEEFKKLLIMRPDIGLLEIREINKRKQILFFNRNVLNERLANLYNNNFLIKINYPRSATLEKCLEHLVQKIRSIDFPHEIGLFLGYPLKDVLGFMGLASLPYIKTQGWKVYGNEKLSDQWYERYQSARKLMQEKIGIGS